jgi:ribose 5-phosphate isomerase B
LTFRFSRAMMIEKWSCGHYQLSEIRSSGMNRIDDAEIHQIVQRVLTQVLGQSQPSAAPVRTETTPGNASQTQAKKVVAIGSDHGGFELKEILKSTLNEMSFDVRDVGAYNKGAVDYPDFAHEVARLVSVGKAWRGIMIDGAGIGSCIVANKVPGVRAGMAYDYSSAVNSREHNDTNVLTLGAGLIGVNLAKQIVKVWLTTEFGGGRHAGRVEKITAVEKQYLK